MDDPWKGNPAREGMQHNMTDPVEVVARALSVQTQIERGYVSEKEAPDAIVTAEGLAEWGEDTGWPILAQAALTAYHAHLEAEGFAIVPVVATEAMWGGLARSIMLGFDAGSLNPRKLFKHLERCGYGIPQWLRDEPEMKSLDHVISKGTRCVIVYRAMIAAAKGEG
jgi:hypothetical protein